MHALAGRLEEPLPKPTRDPTGYAAARTLEAILESLLALEFLRRGYTRNAAGKTFQAWRALTAAILALKLEELVKRLSREEGEWLARKGVTRVPTTRLKRLARLVEKAGFSDYTHYISTALDLHDYQYHGPDPDAELSKYPEEADAAADILELTEKLIMLVEEGVKPMLVERGAWSTQHEEALKALREALAACRKNPQHLVPEDR